MATTQEYQKASLNFSTYVQECWMQTNTKWNVSDVPSIKTDFWLPEPYSFIAAGVYGAYSIFGTVLNIFIIVALIRNKSLRKGYLAPSIFSIAVTDLIFSISVCPAYSILFGRGKPLRSCQIYSFIGFVTWICSALNLLGIASLRCILVHFPGHAKNIKFHQATKVVPLMTWVASVLWILPTAMGKFGQFGVGCKYMGCRMIEQDVDGNIADPEKTLFLAIAAIGIVMFVMNILTYARVSRHNQSMLKNVASVDEVTKNTLKKERKLGIMVAMMTTSFFIVYIPLLILRSIDTYIMTTHPKTFAVAIIFAGSIGIIDPIVYMAFNPQYQDASKSLISDVTSFFRKRIINW